MRSSTSTFIASTVLISLIHAIPAHAQCLDWKPGFHLPGFNGDVKALVAFDDGSGPALYAGGVFTHPTSGIALSVAKWNGTTWSALGSDFDNAIVAMTVFDDGFGPALYAAGGYTPLSKWNGTSWSQVGNATTLIESLTVFDDGSGPALYAGGSFGTAGGVSASRIAKWNGSSWSALGSGLTIPASSSAHVAALTVFDDGSGPALYAGGRFTLAGGSGASNIAKWNGTSWSALSSGITGGVQTVRALSAHDDGSGSALFVGGLFTTAGGSGASNIAKWNGTGWSTVSATGMSGEVRTFTVHDDGSGAALYAGGGFTTAGGVSAFHVAKWNGTSWSELPGSTVANVGGLTSVDLGAGSELYVGAGPSASVAKWDGASWSVTLPAPAGGEGMTGNSEDVTTLVDAFAVVDLGSGPALYAGGGFRKAGSTFANCIAQWNGTSWTALGSGIDPATGYVTALLGFDDGSGPALFVGGAFVNAGAVSADGIARWNGSSWSALGSGVNGLVTDLAVFDDGSGPALFVSGWFTTAGGSSANRMAKWNGTSWSALGTGMNEHADSLSVYDDGTGAALYAIGRFATAGGVTVNSVAKWNGTSWSALGVGAGNPGQYPTDSVVFDDGSGPALYIGGNFFTAGGMAAVGFAKWNGTSWTPLPGVMSGGVGALTVFDDGSGPALYGAGNFVAGAGSTGEQVAKWDGPNWSVLGTGLQWGRAWAMGVFDDGADSAPDLYIGGDFSKVGDTNSENIAEWLGCSPGQTYCFGDGLDAAVTAQCPCSNFGDPGHGCANSNALLGGARLWATGTTNPNTILMTCNGIPNNTLCTFFRNTANVAAGSVYGDGIRCLGGTGIRFGQQNSGQGGNLPNTVTAGVATIPTGLTRYYQVQYRNPAPAFCPPATFNASNGYIIAW